MVGFLCSLWRGAGLWGDGSCLPVVYSLLYPAGMVRLSPLLLFLLLLSCTVDRPLPVVKVGLLAPFEGERRELGYHLLPAIRAATPEQVRGQRVEWVILDTHGAPEIARQRAAELAVDPAVLAVVGPLLPEEVAAVAPLVEQAGLAWWPLAPAGEEGVSAWLGPVEGDGWGAAVSPAIRRGERSTYVDPRLPDDLGEFASLGGERPWPQDWLAWQATRLAFRALQNAERLDRTAALQAATALPFPPPALYQSLDGSFPGILLGEP